MIARIRVAVRTALFVLLALTLCGFATTARVRPQPAPPTPAYSPPPPEESPFNHPDQFCLPSANHFDGVAATAAQRRSQPAVVVWLAEAGAPGGRTEAAAAEAFGRIVQQCGGIGGRPFEVHVVRETGDAVTDCRAALRVHPMMVVATATPLAASCIVRDQRTILVTGGDVSNADLTGSGGRFVADAPTEGIDTARLLALVESGRLDGRKAAIVAPPDATGAEFRRAARAALATKGMRPVALVNADTVLEPTLDLGALPSLEASTAAMGRKPALDVYGFDAASASIPAALDAEPPATARLLRSLRLHAFSPVSDPSYRARSEPNTFSSMCNRAAVDEPAARRDPTTTTTEPQPPLDPSYLSTADVCLLMRIVTRGLFAAGPTLDQRALITALHRLPYLDQAAPAGTPKPRPNQIVNEPVRRIEQVVVLDQAQLACPVTSANSTSTQPTPTVACWTTAPGWDDGGVVVNVPLATPRTPVSH